MGPEGSPLTCIDRSLHFAAHHLRSGNPVLIDLFGIGDRNCHTHMDDLGDVTPDLPRVCHSVIGAYKILTTATNPDPLSTF